MSELLNGFESQTRPVGDISLHYRVAGSGPPLVLLHGYPQTHVMWHEIAPYLAQDFTVFLPDLRGYGDSSKPPGGANHDDPNHRRYSKRQMATDIIGLMNGLGIERFDLVGHDRGARVGHRLCLDHPDRVRRLALLDIVPTHAIFTQTDQEIATKFYHWFFLAQPQPFPETMIGRDPGWWHRLDQPGLVIQHAGGKFKPQKALTINRPEAVDEYERCFNDPAAIHASCEDYRAGATADMADDAVDFGRQKIEQPTLFLWGKGFIGQRFDVVSVWQQYATNLRGQELNCGHFVAEEAPMDTLLSLQQFLTSSNP